MEAGESKCTCNVCFCRFVTEYPAEDVLQQINVLFQLELELPLAGSTCPTCVYHLELCQRLLSGGRPLTEPADQHQCAGCGQECATGVHRTFSLAELPAAVLKCDYFGASSSNQTPAVCLTCAYTLYSVHKYYGLLRDRAANYKNMELMHDKISEWGAKVPPNLDPKCFSPCYVVVDKKNVAGGGTPTLTPKSIMRGDLPRSPAHQKRVSFRIVLEDCRSQSSDSDRDDGGAEVEPARKRRQSKNKGRRSHKRLSDRTVLHRPSYVEHSDDEEDSRANEIDTSRGEPKSDESDPEEALPKRRGRGRPRKSNLIKDKSPVSDDSSCSAGDDSSSENKSKPLKGVPNGSEDALRRRKVMTSPSLVGSKAHTPTGTKRRGRPPKRATETEDSPRAIKLQRVRSSSSSEDDAIEDALNQSLTIADLCIGDKSSDSVTEPPTICNNDDGHTSPAQDTVNDKPGPKCSKKRISIESVTKENEEGDDDGLIGEDPICTNDNTKTSDLVPSPKAAANTDEDLFPVITN